MKNSGLFFEHGKMVFFGLFFEVVMLLWFVFGVFGIVPEVLNMFFFFFPSFLGFCGVAYSSLFWVWKV